MGTLWPKEEYMIRSVIKTFRKNKITIFPQTVYYDEKTKTISKDVVGTFTQFPVKLAYAITIHKSQGQTYSAVKIDLARGAFAPGQVYVALSRCQNLNNLYLTRPLSARDIIVSPTVVDYMDRTAKIIDPDSL